MHNHPYNEMFYVLDGEIEIGGVTYAAGACIFIEKGTPYGPTRAPKGGKVLRYAEAPSESRVEIYTEVLGLRTFYIKVGDGAVSLLCHGGSPGPAHVNWKLNFEPLAAAGFAVYAFDQPGFGLTDNPADYSIDFRFAHAQRLRRYDEARKLPRHG